MSVYVYSAVFGEKYYPLADWMIHSLRETGYDREIFLLTDGIYCADDENVHRFHFDLDYVPKSIMYPDQPEYYARYYIDQYFDTIPDNLLYMDIDCFVIPGRSIEDLAADVSMFMTSPVTLGAQQQSDRWVYLSGIPGELLGGRERAVTSTIFWLKQDHVRRFLDGVRDEMEYGTGRAEEAYVNAFLYKNRHDFPWGQWDDAVYQGPHDSRDWEAAPGKVIHHVMNWWRK